MRVLTCFLFLSLLTPTISAQDSVVGSRDMHAINVDTVVRGSAGQPVSGLSRENFQLLENGRPQSIVNFYEIRPGAGVARGPQAASASNPSSLPPAEMQIRRFVIFIDSYSLRPSRRIEIAKSLQKFVETHVRPGDEAEVVLWTRALTIVTPFTTDKKLLQSGIASLSERSSSANNQIEVEAIKRRYQNYVAAADRRQIGWNDAFERGKAEAKLYADQAWVTARSTTEAMRYTLTMLAGVEGKKALVVAAAHLPEDPGLELRTFLYSAFAPYYKPLQGIGDVSPRGETISIEELAREANADGVTVYVIDAADAGHAGASEQPPPDIVDQSMSFTAQAVAFQRLAALTGGIAIGATSDFDGAFKAIAQDLDSYYLLGYKPESDAEGTRTLAVKTNDPAHIVRSRRTYTVKSAEEKLRDRVVANIFHAGVTDRWDVKVRTGTPQKNGDRFALPIEVIVPSTVTLVPQGENLVGGYEVYVAVGSDNGAVSKVTKSEQPIRIPRTEEAQLRATPFVFTATIMLRGGESTVSVAAVDQVSRNTGFARSRVTAK